jgi:hypothetical protein
LELQQERLFKLLEQKEKWVGFRDISILKLEAGTLQ